MRLLPLLAVAAIVAGCGSMSEDEYTARFEKATDTVQRAMAAAGPDAAKLDAGSRAIAGAADDLAGTHPPAADRRFNREFVGGLRKLSSTLHQAAQASRNGEFGVRDDILGNLNHSPGMQQLRAAERELDKLSG